MTKELGKVTPEGSTSVDSFPKKAKGTFGNVSGAPSTYVPGARLKAYPDAPIHRPASIEETDLNGNEIVPLFIALLLLRSVHTIEVVVARVEVPKAKEIAGVVPPEELTG